MHAPTHAHAHIRLSKVLSPPPARLPTPQPLQKTQFESKIATLPAEQQAAIKARWAARKAGPATTPTAGGRHLLGRGGWGGKSGGPMMKCTACADTTAYALVEGRCKCAPGYGWPKFDKASLAAGTKPPKTCTKCAEGTVSGPAAPYAAYFEQRKASWAAKAGRALLAADAADGGRHGGKGAMSMCVPCADGKEANPTRTACV